MKKLFLLIYRTFAAVYFRFSISPNSVGKKFYSFGQNMSFRYLSSFEFRNFLYYFIQPVVLMRLLEFEFAIGKIKKNDAKILDVSSPRLFSFYTLKQFPSTQIEMFNPDKYDILETQKQAAVFGLNNRLLFKNGFEDFMPNSFDYIVSISVIEHVNTKEVADFLKSIYSILRPTGELILTFPVAKKTYDEYRNVDTYGVGATKLDNEKFFYQRVHDEQTLELQILRVWQSLGGVMGTKEVMGFDADFSYEEYMSSFRQDKLGAGFRNLAIVGSKARYYSSCDDLLGRGVCGVTLHKI